MLQRKIEAVKNIRCSGKSSPPLEMRWLSGRLLCLCCHGGITGVPQVSIPGATIDGLPIGLSIFGGRGSDATLVTVARALAAAI